MMEEENKMSEEQEVKAQIVIEMMGRPAEHVSEAMKNFIKKLGEEEKVKVIEKKVHAPKIVEQKDQEGKAIKIQDGKEIYSTFSEIVINTESIMDLIRIVFTYMPSHVEILHPSESKLKSFDLSAVLSEITKKMHQYDAIAKNALLQNQALANKLAMYERGEQPPGSQKKAKSKKEGGKKKGKKK